MITSRAGRQTILVFTEESRLIVIPLADISSIVVPITHCKVAPTVRAEPPMASMETEERL